VPLRRFQKKPCKRAQVSEALRSGNAINMSSYHMPDGYCDPTAPASFDDTGHFDALPSRLIIDSLLSFEWLHDIIPGSPSHDLETALSRNNEFDSSNCHLPEEFIDSTLLYTYSAHNNEIRPSSGNMFLDDLSSFMSGDESDDGGGNDGNDYRETTERSDSSFNDCDVLYEYVHPIMSSSNNSESRPYIMALDRLSEKIRGILFDLLDSQEKEEEQRRVSLEDSKKGPKSFDALESPVPDASNPRAQAQLRKRTSFINAS
jgi:hypothetical protein